MSPTHSLHCSSLTDVLLFLKASSVVSFDVCESGSFSEGLYDRLERTKFALRVFDQNLSTATEFRVFVREKTVLAICQRHCYERYDALQSSEFRNQLRNAIDQFYQKQVRDVFSQSDLVMDVYFDHRQRVRLLDFAPFHPMTNPLLFDWEVLKTVPLRGQGVLSQSTDNIRFRFIEADEAPMNMSSTFFAGVPADLTTLSDNAQDAIRRLAEEYRQMDEELSERPSQRSSTRDDSDEECEV